MLFKLSSLFLFVLALSYSCESSSSKGQKLVRYDGKLMDKVVLKERSLIVFQFDTKDVKCLNKEFSIKNTDGLIFGISGQTGVQLMRGFAFTKGSDTMYIEIGGGFSHDLIRMDKFVRGYFSYIPERISLLPDFTMGRSFIDDKRVREIPILYDDYRGGQVIRNIGETDFSVTEVSYANLKNIHRLLLESTKEEVRKL